MSEVYDLLKPFGFIPGTEDKRCMDCGLVFALMDKEATRCKRCARKAMNSDPRKGMPDGPDANEMGP